MNTDTQQSPTGNNDGYWDSHWTSYSEATRLNPAQTFRRNLILRMFGIAGQKQDTRILDVGCGSGDQLVAMSTHFPNAQFAGIDQSATAVSVASGRTPGALCRKADLNDDSAVPAELRNWATHAVCSEVLEHLEKPVEALKNLRDYLQPGSTLIITVPGGPKSTFDLEIGHLRHYTPALLREELTSGGYDVEFAYGAGFPTFNLYRLAVISRGHNLKNDIAGRPSLVARTVMTLFRVLLRFSLFSSPWGWQVIALARKPE